MEHTGVATLAGQLCVIGIIPHVRIFTNRLMTLFYFIARDCHMKSERLWAVGLVFRRAFFFCAASDAIRALLLDLYFLPCMVIMVGTVGRVVFCCALDCLKTN